MRDIMQLIIGLFLLIVSIKIGAAYGFTAGFWSFILLPFGVGMLYRLIINSIKSAAADARSGRRTITMEQGVDILQKCIYLTIHGAMRQDVCNRIESDLGNERMSNPRPLRHNELKPPVTKLDFDYANEAVHTVVNSGYLYEGEGEEIKARMEAKLDSIRDEFTDLPRGKKSDTDRAVDNMMEALR
jgi:hypothetical protein